MTDNEKLDLIININKIVERCPKAHIRYVHIGMPIEELEYIYSYTKKLESDYHMKRTLKNFIIIKQSLKITLIEQLIEFKDNHTDSTIKIAFNKFRNYMIENNIIANETKIAFIDLLVELISYFAIDKSKFDNNNQFADKLIDSFNEEYKLTIDRNTLFSNLESLLF